MDIGQELADQVALDDRQRHLGAAAIIEGDAGRELHELGEDLALRLHGLAAQADVVIAIRTLVAEFQALNTAGPRRPAPKGRGFAAPGKLPAK